MMKQPIVAVEPDSDISTHRRIDQGLIDASNEAQNQVLYPPNTAAAAQKSATSWWGFSTGASTTTAPPQPSQVAPNINSLNVSLPTVRGVKSSTDTAKHRRTVSYKGTYRVP